MGSLVDDRATKRRRRIPSQSYDPFLTGDTLETSLADEEERLLAQAISNSRVDKRRDSDWLAKVPFGPTFYPTVEEFSGDPLVYLEKIRSVAEKYGICKIVPPKGWNPSFALNVDCPKRFQTKDQSIHRLQEGISFGDGSEYTVKEYQRMASDWSKEWRRDQGYAVPDDISEMKKDPSIPNDVNTVTFDEKNVSPLTPHDAERGKGALGAQNSNSLDCVKSSSKGVDIPQSLEDKSMGRGEHAAGAQPKKIMTLENLERDYWDIVETQSYEVDVDYGNDVDTSDFGSGFPLSDRGRSVNSPNFQSSDKEESPEPAFGTEEFYKETYWNLNNIPNSRSSVLQHIKVGINGINVPWLYFGCLFSTFCWHTEDNYMYSINYHHRGAPKQWYGIPGTKEDADGVERCFKNYLSMKMRDVPDLIHHITTSFSPRTLKQEGVRVVKLVQHAGEYVITFPRSFHGGFSYGPNCGEAVNFALHDWIPYGVVASERYRTFGRPSVFSHDRLIYTIAYHANQLRTKEICVSLAKELRRMMGEELVLRSKLIKAGVRDVSKEVELPPNRLDQLDEESADYDDKRLCHSCKHICFFSAVACECSESKVSCLRHSHYMCRCSTKRKYLLVWTTEAEMNDAISRVEARGDSLDTLKPMTSMSCEVGDSLEGAPGSSGDLKHHKTFEVPVDSICADYSEVPLLVHSDTSCCS